jgi:hypothetical protein
MNKTLPTLLLLGLCALARAEFVTFSWDGTMETIDSITGRATTRAVVPNEINASAIAPDGTIYISWDRTRLSRVDPGTGTVTAVGVHGLDIRGLSFVGNTLYAIHHVDAQNDRLYTINTTTAAPTLIGNTNHTGLQSLATRADGFLVSWDTSLAGMVTVNAATGATTDVNPSVGSAPGIQGMDIDAYGVLWGVNRGHLYRIDLATGRAKLVARTADIDHRALTISRNVGRMMAIDLNGRLWNIDLTTGRGQQLVSGIVSNGNLCAMPDGRLWCEAINRTSHLNPGNGQRTQLATPISAMGSVATTGGVLYAITRVGTQELYRLDTTTGAATLIGATGRTATIVSLTADAAGTLYAWDTALGLMTVSKTTGVATDVHATGAASQVTAIEFAPNGNLYGAGTTLFRLSKTTGAIIETIGSGNYTSLQAMASVPMQGRALGVDNAGSIYDVNLDAPSSTLLSNTGFAVQGVTAWPVGKITGVLTNPNPDEVHEIDRSTGVVNPAFLFQAPNTASWVNCAISDGKMVLSGQASGGAHRIAQIQYPSGLFVSESGMSLGSPMIGMTATRDGSIFGYATANGLIQIHAESGAFFPVDLAPPGTNQFTLAFMPDGRCYSASGFSLFSVNPLNGDLTSIGNIGHNSRDLLWSGPVVSGNGTLEGWLGPDHNLFYEIEIRHPGTLEAIETHLVHPQNGVISFASTLWGTYDVAVKPRTGLRRVFPNRTIVNEAILGNAIWLNGDADNDNEVTVGDYALLSDNFGRDSSHPLWDARADLDGDEEITIGDVSILSANFGAAGDD